MADTASIVFNVNTTEAEFSGISVLGIIHLVKSNEETDQGVSNGATLFKV